MTRPIIAPANYPVALIATTLLAGYVSAAPAASAPPQPCSLRHVQIWLAPDQPAFVRRAAEDLREIIHQRTGQAPELSTIDDPEGTGSRPIIEIGLNNWKQAAADLPAPQRDRSEAYVLRGDGGQIPSRRPIISVDAHDPQGLKFGLIRLIGRLQLGKDDVTLPLPFHETGAPVMAVRGMYAHLHWSYNHPYALRSWQLDDWKRYVDLLTHLGYNRLQIWPMMEIIPHPLSPEDNAYLGRYAEIIDYAHRQRGMQVVVGSCPNSITQDARGVPIANREYFDFEKRLNPGDPVQLSKLLEYRSDLYRTLPNADGYWVIDSDPGGWKGSPSSQFVDILIGHRKLIDAWCSRPKEQPLIYWIWFGWGTGPRPENWRSTLTDMKKRLPEPWRLYACNPEHIAVCRELNLLDKVIYYPYNTLETEPGGPLTDLRFDRIAKELRIARDAGLTGIQGNTQTPLVQLPNIACLSAGTWHATPPGDEAVLSDLAARLLCKDADVLVAAWRSLNQADDAASLVLADRLRALAKDPAAAGTLAVVMGDWQARVLEDLAAMLDLHARAIRFARQAESNTEPSMLVDSLAAFIASGANWLDRTGFHNRDPITHRAYRTPVADALTKLVATMGRDALMARVVTPATTAAEKLCKPEVCRLVVDSVLPKDKERK